MADRDDKGRFQPGNQLSRGPCEGRGRPRQEDADKLTAALSQVLASGTLVKWAAAMERKLERADPWATDFTFNRLLGKVPDRAELTGATGEPFEVVIRYVTVPRPDSTGEA